MGFMVATASSCTFKVTEVSGHVEHTSMTARLRGKCEMAIYVDGEYYNYGQAPIVLNGSTLVPLRAFDPVVTDLTWQAETRTVVITP